MIKRITFLVLSIVLPLLSIAQNARTVLEVTASSSSTSSFTDKEVVINGKSDLHITALPAATPLNNSIVKLNSIDSWVFFDNVRPQYVIDNLLKFVYINNVLAVNKTNCRVAIYKQGTVVIPQSSSFQPLKVYTGQNFSGDSTSYSLFTINAALGTFDNKIRSFKLKRGYMATVANGSDGLGYSRVFIADSKDLDIAVMPGLLEKTISFIKVVNWEWVSKKGWCGSDFNQYSKLNATWRYDWSAGGSTTSYVEYVPIKQNLGWPGWSDITNKQYVSHALGYNEPDHTEQSNVTVAQALAEWPNMLKTGLRVGSPAVTNNAWIYEFMDSCKARNYRVDYVAYHAYWGGKSPQSWYNDLKYIHTRTGRPIWITEWNNGANWTNETWPTADKSLSAANAAKQLADIKAILNVLDTASFIERYSIYNWVQDCRAMVLADTLTPAGKYYAADNAPMAYNPKREVIPTYTYKSPSLAVTFGLKNLTLSITDPNGDFYNGYIIERKEENGSFVQIANTENSTVKTFVDTVDVNGASRVRYRAKAKYVNGTTSAYTNEAGMDVTIGEDIQYGKLTFSNVGWNTVYFKKPYSSTVKPAIILGAPTNANSTVFMSARPKLVSYTSRFNVQLAPWSYQNVTALAKEETVPYFITALGTYDFGGLKAVSGQASVGATWTNVTFATPFETTPVVFVSQFNPISSFATGLRIRNVTTTGFQAKLQKETAITTAVNAETISYFAITQGTGAINGNKIIVGKTADLTVGNTTYTTINYGDSIGNPIFIGQMQTCNDDTVTATMRCLTVTDKFVNVMKQRERSTTATLCAKEAAGWMVLTPADVTDGLFVPFYQKLSFYPNPVHDVIYLNQNYAEAFTADIYNLFGMLVKRESVENGQINVSDLPAGSYIVRTLNHGSNKFIKL